MCRYKIRPWLLLATSLLLLAAAAPGFAQFGPVDTPWPPDTPFNQAPELDSACPNGNCTFQIGGNYDRCHATGSAGQFCYSCGQDALNNSVSCSRTSKSASCGCKVTQDPGTGKLTTCKDLGWCDYSWD